MNVVLCVVSFVFGALSLIAAIGQMRAEKEFLRAAIMIAGSVLLISAVICNLVKQQFDFVLALIGCATICVAAILNGLKSGNFHIQHHIVRVAISLVLIIGFILL